jgi:hypothetical protein
VDTGQPSGTAIVMTIPLQSLPPTADSRDPLSGSQSS